MTIFAGIVARSKSVAVVDSSRAALRRLISRFPGESVQEFGDENFCLVKVDLGAYGSPGAFVDAEGSISLLAGEPYLVTRPQDIGNARYADLQQLHGDVISKKWNAFGRCAGTFCMMHYHPATGTLCLIADKFGVRPIYYWIGPQFVVFATALRILEQLTEVVKVVDLRGLSEAACFGFSLADRTPYEDVRTIRECEIIAMSGDTEARHVYWRWDRLEATGKSSPEAAERAHQRFAVAIRRRLKDDKTVAAFLSGGLDSRAIVSMLRSLQVTVHTTNWAKSGTQDQVFGAEIALKLGSIHQVTPERRERVGDPYKKLGVRDWLQGELVKKSPLDRSQLVWSGDGGSVGVGHVYLNPKMVEHMEQGLTGEAIQEFLAHNKCGLPRRPFKATVASAMSRIPEEGIRDELERLECSDQGRKLHLFLMFNDQRRHLADLYENIDLERIEFLLPFFDADFLESVLANPIFDCLQHKFYMKWLEHFAPVVTQVAWQAYPGHAPCPIRRDGFGYQWSRDTGPEARREQRETTMRYLRLIFVGAKFPSDLISRTPVLSAALATLLGVRDYSYVLKPVAVFCKHWNISDGKWSGHIPRFGTLSEL